MKAERSNIVNTQRVNLGEVLPLDTPFSLFIDVCNACNFRCKFCAIQTNEMKNFKKQVMSWNLYKKIIDDVTQFPNPLKMLRLTANGEPLINKDLPKMIKYAKKIREVSEHIEIVSNASLLSHELSDALIDAGLDRIRISIEAIDANGYEEICGKKIDWNKFIENIRYFYEHRKQCEVYIKIVDAAVKNEEEKEIFYKEFEDLCDKISIEHVIPIWTGYKKIYEDFNIEREGLHGHALKNVNICPFPFYSFVVNPDGEVTVCCNDWQRGISMGNAMVENVCDIWRGEKYKKFLLGMIEKGRTNNHSTCATCEYPIYDAVDDLDEYRERLLSQFKKEKA